ncbi:hypothetical protein [Pseudodesulfovibrio sp.]|uniref:hypothetical protein n=1 Tax=Pseudodesulfovibrio sp. TaxID=2035812 RepID=UPI00261DD273|nr:hypothetical protein [Pseudodesulfovibrio sp.]MDD3311918.1 hypothetical protein [Pseudodesulfovibrio sp.]
MGMIIQGSHLNHGFMQKLQAQKTQGKNLGDAASLLAGSAGSRLGDGLSVAGRTTAQAAMETVIETSQAATRLSGRGPSTLGQTVADEIVRRMGDLTDGNGETKDASGLRDSLASALDWVRGRFGDEAGAAASAMLLSSTDGAVTEETVGDGLLSTLQFIDRNFGIAAGDNAIATFNSGVNAELNAFFDNGKNEIFYASDSAPTGSGSAEGTSENASLTARFFSRAVQDADAGAGDAPSLTEQLLEQLKDDLEETAGLTDLAAKLDMQFNPARASIENAVAAYSQYAAPAEARFADMVV